MVIIRLMGGLGNQMQQYALYRKYKTLGREAYLDTSWFSAAVQEGMKAKRRLELDDFEGVSYECASKEQIDKIRGNDSLTGKIKRKLTGSCITEDRMYYPELLDRDDIYLEGYWAAEIYYRDILDILKSEFNFSLNIINEACRGMADMIAGCETPVAVHIRRADYLDPENARIFGNIATDEYYEKAFEYMRKQVERPEFFIFSDDPEYIRAVYKDEADTHIVDVNHGRDSRFDMYLMSLCTHHICANSTFSFWGARLSAHHGNGGIDIRPTIQKNSQTFEPKIMKKLWQDWIFIAPDGRLYL